MAVPEYYLGLYVNVYFNETEAVGSGFCFDGQHILTCTHVVNAAYYNDEDKFESLEAIGPKEKFRVVFINDEDLVDEEMYASVLHWGWDEKKLNKMIPERKNAAIMRNDITVLKLETTDAILTKLKKIAKDVIYLKGTLNLGDFESWIIDTEKPGVNTNIKGKMGETDKGTGTTYLYPADVQKSFFKGGGSGAPVYGELTFDDGSKKVGIAGFADFLKEEDLVREARMINGTNLENWFAQNAPALKPRFINVDEYRSQVLGRVLGRSLQENLEKKWGTGRIYLCDRKPQVSAIQKYREAAEARSFLIYGSNRQKLELFVDRYRYQFLDSEGKKSELLSVGIPGERNMDLFYNSLLINIQAAFGQPGKRIPGQDYANFDAILAQFGLDSSKHYVVNWILENSAIRPGDEKIFSWFKSTFLEPVHAQDFSNVHMLFSFCYKTDEDYSKNQDMIKGIFTPHIDELGDIPRNEVEAWLMAVEPTRKEKLLSYFGPGESYTMEDVLIFYKKSIQLSEPF